MVRTFVVAMLGGHGVVRTFVVAMLGVHGDGSHI